MNINKRIARFWERVNKKGADDCWEWLGCLNTWGYGQSSLNSIQMATHRIAWIFSKGSIPNNLHVLHKCDNRKCVNPNHLFLGTHQENMRDKGSKGRTNGFKPQNICIRGHNEWVTLSSGMKQCLPCKRQRSKEFRLRRKQQDGISRKTT